MISYSWATKEQANSLRQYLKDANVPVWFDSEKMQGSIFQKMAEAVEDSRVVLICYSQAYKNSNNCQDEAEYAKTLKKKIIPVLMQEGYKPDGWLGFIVGSKRYYDLSNKKSFELNMPALLKEINDSAEANGVVDEKAIQSLHHPLVDAPPPAKQTPNGLHSWTTDDVMKWLDKENLSQFKDLYVMLDFNSLSF